MRLFAGLCPLLAIFLIGLAHGSATTAFWLFLGLGTAFLTALVGGALCLVVLIQKSERSVKWRFLLALDFCIAAFCAINMFSALVMFVGFSV